MRDRPDATHTPNRKAYQYKGTSSPYSHLSQKITAPLRSEGDIWGQDRLRVFGGRSSRHGSLQPGSFLRAPRGPNFETKLVIGQWRMMSFLEGVGSTLEKMRGSLIGICLLSWEVCARVAGTIQLDTLDVCSTVPKS